MARFLKNASTKRLFFSLTRTFCSSAVESRSVLFLENVLTKGIFFSLPDWSDALFEKRHKFGGREEGRAFRKTS